MLASEAPARLGANKVRCDACPVLCLISPGRTGACDRWGNVDGALTRIDALVVTQQRTDNDEGAVFVTGVGAGTTYPDYKPAPFIVLSRHEGADVVTVVTEGIFSYCSFKVKIDTDRYLGPEQANIRHNAKPSNTQPPPKSVSRPPQIDALLTPRRLEMTEITDADRCSFQHSDN